MQRTQLMDILEEWLSSHEVQDYCPNGLQVEGRSAIKRIVTGVTASQALLDAAVAKGADTVLVHHGYFWKGEQAAVTGMKKRRLKTLLENDINLIAYHLPLDIHPEFGNNTELARLIGLNKVSELKDLKPTGIVRYGELSQEWSGEQLGTLLENKLGRKLTAMQLQKRPIRQVALCTGGGQGFIEAAVASGADAFITGEVSEQTIHVARECDIHFFAAGHHATERYGVKALGERIAERLGLEVEFIDIDNPA